MIKESILTLEKAENGEAKIFNHSLGVSFFIKTGQKFGLRYEYSNDYIREWCENEINSCLEGLKLIGVSNHMYVEVITRLQCARQVLKILDGKNDKQ